MSADTFPERPTREVMDFFDELDRPIHRSVRWHRQHARPDEVSLAQGVAPNWEFPNPTGALETAYEDFGQFLAAAEIRVSGAYRISAEQSRSLGPEGYRVKVGADSCRILAGNTEGVRRALVWIEDAMLSAGGPFLPLGDVERAPVIRTRLRWSCFGDDADDYSEGYLNRIAHDGGNGLILKALFRDLVPSQIIPEYGRESEPRLDRLRRLVQKCARYGLRISLYVNEPRAFDADDPVLAAHPDLTGHRAGKTICFCTETQLGGEYLEESTRTLFELVPGLGGLVDITVGERPTHCYSMSNRLNNCPRCSKKEPDEVLTAMLARMKGAMASVAPDAELISWPYTQYGCWGREATVTSASRVPDGVALMHNFESDGREKQLGKWRYAHDYWLSYVGPSDLFRRCARTAVGGGRRAYAKMTVAASHELGTVVCIPVPGILYDKYSAMHELGVSGATETFDFGNYPSLMTRAAGQLSFAPFPTTKEDFLFALARRDWGEGAPRVAEAWQWFEKGYRNIPLNINFSYYGPMHDGPVWPLYLKPVDAPLAPKWFFGWPNHDGDRIGECVTYTHSLDEAITLCREVSQNWDRGLEIMKPLMPRFADSPDRIKELRTAQALGLQFRSGCNILEFYRLREKMLKKGCADRLSLLHKMKEIVHDELTVDRRLLPLTEADSHLGYHPECHGHRYFPAAIRWRIASLEALLAADFPEVERVMRGGESLFPIYTGERPEGPTYRCMRLESPAGVDAPPTDDAWQRADKAACTYEGFRYACTTDVLREASPNSREVLWKAAHDDEALYFQVVSQEPDVGNLQADGEDRTRLEPLQNDLVTVSVEPRRLWPPIQFTVNAKGVRYMVKPGFISLDPVRYRWQARSRCERNAWLVNLRIPFAEIELGGPLDGPVRVAVARQSPDAERGGFHTYQWIIRHPFPCRLNLETANPADLGWLVFV